MDVVDQATRSRMMAGIRGKNTKPEMLVRTGLHRRGFRFKLHDKTLPGRPDLVLPRYRAVIFVHGCFWHMHGCSLSKLPATRTEFWKGKLTANRQRDAGQVAALHELGYRCLLIWECALRPKGRNIEIALDAAASWLKGAAEFGEISRESVAASTEP